MRLISTTLACPGTESIIGDALRSVAPYVDACLVIWTGQVRIDPEDEIFDAALGGFFSDADGVPLVDGSTVSFQHWPWRDDFAAARNAALVYAAELGAEWALTVDTDERMLLDPAELEEALVSPVGAWMVRDRDQNAVKERLIRVPAGQQWVGRTHEAYQGHLDPRGRGTLERSSYWELPKTPEQNAAKFARDERILREEIAAHPEQSRWHFYLGVTLRGLDRLDEAVDAFRRCALISGWPEEAGWSCWEAANILHNLGRHEEALQACASGLMRYPGIAELCWTAAGCCLALGRRDEARDWAKLAKVHGHAGDGVALRRRMLWRAERALGPGPDEILAALI